MTRLLLGAGGSRCRSKSRLSMDSRRSLDHQNFELPASTNAPDPAIEKL